MAAPTRPHRTSSTPVAPRKGKGKEKATKDRKDRPTPPPKPASPGQVPPPETGKAPPVIEFRGVAMEYDSGDVGLEQATFSIARGDFVFLVGPSGSGKSTLIRLMIKELDPTAGKIRVAGRDLSEITAKGVPFYRRNLGVVFQDYKLLANRTVYDNVAYALQVTGHSRKEIRAKVPDILRLTGLATKLHNFPDQLSGGEQQRVSIARAFVNHPPLLVADEPTGNLDPETSIGIMQLLYRINLTGTTVVVATHDKEMVDKMRRRVIQLEQGQVIRDEAAGFYTGDESTREFAARMRDGDPGPDAKLPVSRAGKRYAKRETRREVDALPRERIDD
jgi:cell division transport system ATP-binding protein